jgi:hypothetical protein
MLLAVGMRMGHPWIGVLLGIGLMCGCLCWMLQGWVSPRFALLGGILAALNFSGAYYWANSYWGGGIAAAGGALVIGSLPRLRAGRVSGACALALGLVVLANSRPYEGAGIAALSILGFLAWTWRDRSRWLRAKVLLPAAAILALGGAWVLYYNVRTTGNPFMMPYGLNQDRFAHVPQLWILPPLPAKPATYRDEPMRVHFEEEEVATYNVFRRNPAYALYSRVPEVFERMTRGAGQLFVFLFACGLVAAGSRKVRTPLWIGVAFLALLAVECNLQAHYVAPAIGAYVVVCLAGARVLYTTRVGARRIGPAVLTSLMGLAAFLALINALRIVQESHEPKMTAVAFQRSARAKLQQEAGEHLVLVRYAPDHFWQDEVIYNTPDIASQKIIWAFDFGPEKDRPLLEHFRGRRVWLMQPDGPNPTIEPYSE